MSLEILARALSDERRQSTPRRPERTPARADEAVHRGPARRGGRPGRAPSRSGGAHRRGLSPDRGGVELRGAAQAAKFRRRSRSSPAPARVLRPRRGLQVLTNLISNSAEGDLADGAARRRARGARVHEVLFVVSDTGPGIAQAMSHLFERLARGPEAGARAPGWVSSRRASLSAHGGRSG